MNCFKNKCLTSYISQHRSRTPELCYFIHIVTKTFSFVLDFDTMLEARHNAKVVLKFTTAYPFRLPSNDMVCVYCCKSFEEPAGYRQHMKEEHVTFDINIACAHIRSLDFVKADCTDLECRICREPFDCIDSIANHLVVKHKKNIIKSAELGLQVFKLGSENWMCGICKGKWPCLRTLSRHISSHYHKFTCETCGRSYANKENLQRHVQVSHTKGKMCIKCKKFFPDCEARREHILKSPKCWTHCCDRCGERFIDGRRRREHLIVVHQAQRKVYTCRECDKVFLRRPLYTAHFVVAHTNNSLPCPYCEQKFPTNRELNRHKLLHTKEKQYLCNVCSKSFARKSGLTQHMWIHKEQKRFECVPCSKKFNQRVSWKTHMRSYHPELVDF
jgi:KRAB domain-containing zinc finger protein